MAPSLPFSGIAVALLASQCQAWTIANANRRSSFKNFACEPRSSSIPALFSTTDEQSIRLEPPEDGWTDEQILETVTIPEMQSLCVQLGVDDTGTKMEMLKGLRDRVDELGREEQERRAKRKQRVESSDPNSKERHEIIDGEEEDDEEQFFYYSDEGVHLGTRKKSEGKGSRAKAKAKTKKPNPPVNHRHSVIAPPPPTEVNENGERVVTVYSTTDQNDLTGVAAAQPQAARQRDPMVSGGGGGAEDAPWDMEANYKKKATSAQVDAAKEKLTDLVQQLLAMTGAPGFQDDGGDDEDFEALGIIQSKGNSDPNVKFVGFDPSKVDTETMAAASGALRVGRGEILSDVIRQFEMRAVGYDGMAGDDVEKGGGHYREVSKVRSFLEGFRRAEVRSHARETATMLLDKLVSEGVQGLDMTLMAMTRSGEDGGFGELNDSLLDFLDDEVKKQEKKVERTVEKKDDSLVIEATWGEPGDDEHTDKVWKFEVDNGQRVETFDPRDPYCQKAMQDFMIKEINEPRPNRAPIPESPAEKLLLILKLLRDRVKTEAKFPNDEKSRNLRILSYCLHASTKEDRMTLIRNEFGKSFDRLDSFIELVSSSIEYGESTSHQLQPNKQGSLNVRLLKQIKFLAKDVRAELTKKTSGDLMP